ncbi:MAG: dephospho-CoA kinase [Gemmobacter sp.]
MTAPFRLGLTGSIGMGKSTTAGFFAARGIPVWDADATVHRLYAPGAAGAAAIAAAIPAAIGPDGGVSRPALRSLMRDDPALLERLGALIHPLVAADRAAFIAAATADIVLLDIPLLYETGGEGACDAVLLVTAPPEVQMARLRARGTMTAPEIAAILARQMPDRDKRARATHIVETLSHAAVDAYVEALLAHIRSRPHA